MTAHPCHGDPAALIDHLASLPDPTPLEQCILHTLRDQADIIDRATGLMEGWGRADKRYKRLVQQERAALKTAHREELAQRDVTIAHLRSRLAEQSDQIHRLVDESHRLVALLPKDSRV